ETPTESLDELATVEAGAEPGDWSSAPYSPESNREFAAESSLAAWLHEQLLCLPLPEADLRAAAAVIDSLDDDGYLRTSLAEIAKVADVGLPDMETALHRV